MRSKQGLILFGGALVALTALVIHWSMLLWRLERGWYEAHVALERMSAIREARRLGDRAGAPATGSIPGKAGLEVVRVQPQGPLSAGTYRLTPRHPTLAVRVTARAMQDLRDKRRRRSFMVFGEGSFAVALLLVWVVMLYRLLRGERHRRQEIQAFVRTVSHELKTPLAGIKSLLQTLEAGRVPADRQTEFLEMGLREVDRLEHLVENILIANRIRRSALTVDLQPVELAPFIDAFLEHRRRLLPHDRTGGIDLREPPPPGAMVLADRDKLRVILENLTDNALKYGEDGEVRLGVQIGDESVEIYVEDDGVGFDPAQREALFHGNRPAARDQGSMAHGTGLGLGIARQLARAQQGELEAHSPGRGRGARFTVRLARAPDGAGEDTHA